MLKYNSYVLNESTAILLKKKSIDCLHLKSMYIIKIYTHDQCIYVKKNTKEKFCKIKQYCIHCTYMCVSIFNCICFSVWFGLIHYSAF